MAVAARDSTGLPALTTVGCFSPLPELQCAAGSVALPTSRLALAAVRAPIGVLHGGAQNESRLATTPDEPGAVERASRWPRCDAPAQLPLSDSQIHPFEKSGVEPSSEAHPRPRDREICLCPEAHHVCNPQQLAPPVAFLYLTIYQLRRYLPLTYLPPSATSLKPVAEMGREGREIHI
jgi:hypothetical protein